MRGDETRKQFIYCNTCEHSNYYEKKPTKGKKTNKQTRKNLLTKEEPRNYLNLLM